MWKEGGAWKPGSLHMHREMVSYRKQKRQIGSEVCTVWFYMQCQCWNKHAGRAWLRAHQFRLQFRFRYFAIPQNQRLSRGSKLSSSVAEPSHAAHYRALAGEVMTVKPLWHFAPYFTYFVICTCTSYLWQKSGRFYGKVRDRSSWVLTRLVC